MICDRSPQPSRSQMKRISDITSIMLLLCALTVTGLLVRRELFPPSRGPSIRTVEGADHLATGGTLMGPANATLKIVEFSDFQCPFCARVQTHLRTLRDRYPDRVAVVYRHFPLT